MRYSDRKEKLGAHTVVLSEDGIPHSLLIQKYKLLIVSGLNQGKEAIIDNDVFTIGAGSQNSLILQDTAVSRRHCEIQIAPAGFLIRDLNSTNGTIMHDVKICEAFLSDGAEFQVGNTRIVFCPLQETISHPLSRREKLGRVVGSSISMRRVFHLAETFAPTDAAILIEGETGTGKEILAEAIHSHSQRGSKPFAVIDCESLAKGLVESELFGHVKGSFTGAATDRVGAFEHADGGTVFLDEIGEMDLDMQPKLLRVLEKKEIRRTGANILRKVDFRLISATNKKLESEVNRRLFREDLFYRLSMVKIEIPPLRKRKEDIPLLVRHFVAELSGSEDMDRFVDFERTVELLSNYEWPGNVRELKNLIEMAYHSGPGKIDISSFVFMNRMKGQGFRSSSIHSQTLNIPFKAAKQQLIAEFDKDYVKNILEKNGWNISKAAREAKIERAYLQRLIKKYGFRMRA